MSKIIDKIKRVNLSKEMYDEAQTKNLSFTELLECEDPTQEYGNSPFAKLDAYERQLIAHGLYVNPVMAKLAGGAPIVKLSAFYTSNNAVLFPEYINRQFDIGAQLAGKFLMDEDLCASVNEVEGTDFKGLKMDIDTAISENHMQRRAEGARGRKYTITVGKREVTIYEYQADINISYKALETMSVNMLDQHLQLIGTVWKLDCAIMALAVAVNGNPDEGNSASNENTGGVWTESLLQRAKLNFKEPFTPTIIAASGTVLGDVYDLAGFKANGYNPFLVKGEIQPILGAEVKQVSSQGEATALGTTKLLLHDKNRGLRKLKQRNAQLIETDKIISKRLEEVALTETVAYVKEFDSSQTITKT